MMMGLDTSHDAWHGAYSAFSRWRDAVTRAAGYDFESDPAEPWRMYPRLNWEKITEDNLMGLWDSTPEDPLIVLIAHSDCDGSIRPEQAGPLADRLEQLLPLLSEEGAGGHIDSVAGVTKRFIQGLRAAAAANEPVAFG